MKQLFRSHSLLGLISIAVFAFAVAGCGGGGTGGSTTQNASLPSFNNGKIGPVTAAQLAAAQTAVDSVWANGVNGSQLAATYAVLTEISKLPVFRAGGVTPDGGIWGEYTNGTEVLFGTNDQYWPANKAMATRSRPKPVIHARPTAGGEISGSGNAYVIETIEPALEPIGTQLAAELTAAGFNVTSLAGHLSDWASVNGAGVLYASSHGMYNSHLTQFYQETADQQSKALDSQYATQLAKNIILTGRIMVNDTALTAHPGHREEGVDFHFETRYWFGASFLTNPSMFAKNSIMIDDCCSGMEDGGNYADYLENQLGLSVFSGWTNTVGSFDCTGSSLFLFDRLLGLDKVAPIDPTNPPPATWSDVFSTMQTTTRPGDPYNYVTSYTEFNKTSELSYRASSSNQLQTIIPSIETAQLDSTGKTVTINGYFGSTQGTVKFNGSYMTINSWASGSIVVTAPTESTGVIVVEGAVTGGKGFLDSNSYKYSNITLSHNPKLSVGAKQTFTAAGPIPANAKFEWTLVGNGSIGSSNSVTTTLPTIIYTAPSNFTTDTLSVKVVTANGQGVGSASDTISVSSNLIFTPANPNLLPQQQQLITISAVTGSLPAGVQFKWTLTGPLGYGPLGSIGDSATITTTAPSITYTAADGLGKDNLQVQLVDSSGKVEASATTIITTAIQLVITPASANLTPGETKTFVASALHGHIPPKPNYAILWSLTGHGDVSSSPDTLTLTYTAPATSYDSTIKATLEGLQSKDFGSVTIPITMASSTAINPSTSTFDGPGEGGNFYVTGTYPTGTTYKWSCKSGTLYATGTVEPYPNTLTTTAPQVTYEDANPPANGSTASDILSVTVIGPTGEALGTATATISYGGTPFFEATYPYTPDNDKIITGDVDSYDMRTLLLNGGSSILGVEDLEGFFEINISTTTGGVLAAGQSYTLDESNPITQQGIFYLAGALVENSPPLKTGTLKITSIIPAPGGGGNFVAFSINILCEDGQTIVANGVVLQATNGGETVRGPKSSRSPGPTLLGGTRL